MLTDPAIRLIVCLIPHLTLAFISWLAPIRENDIITLLEFSHSFAKPTQSYTTDLIKPLVKLSALCTNSDLSGRSMVNIF